MGASRQELGPGCAGGQLHTERGTGALSGVGSGGGPHSPPRPRLLQIATLLRDNERIQSTQTVTPNDEDSDIKKIKKVCAVLF